jgi:hypothetical protein
MATAIPASVPMMKPFQKSMRSVGMGDISVKSKKSLFSEKAPCAGWLPWGQLVAILSSSDKIALKCGQHWAALRWAMERSVPEGAAAFLERAPDLPINFSMILGHFPIVIAPFPASGRVAFPKKKPLKSRLR